ncbi:MAG TPA: hypothetical protein VMT87_10810 [Vicinamibacteria bacterium]|nr:hypothetical protein [Vicinamibacteria bacterium]
MKTVPPEWTEPAIRRYLLGLLPEAEAEALEDAYLGDPEVLGRVRAVEDDLLDDYAAGRLTRDAAGHFESRYLPSPYLRRRVTAARALRLAADTPAPMARQAPSGPMRWRGPLAIAAGLLVAVAMAFALRPSRPAAVATVPAPPPTLAALPPSPPATPSPDPKPTSPVVTPATIRVVVALSPVLLRGASGPVEVRVPRRTSAVVLELQGDPAVLGPRPGATLGATIETVEGATVWRGGARVRDPRRSTVVASVEVPAERLAPADYVVTLSRAEEVLYRYSFRVPAR